MIGWHEVDFHHVREGKTHYHVRCCPINNKDTRLVMRGPSSEWKEGEGPFTAGVWDAGERECFQQLRAKLAELEAPANEVPRVVRSEPGGYAEPEGKLRKS